MRQSKKSDLVWMSKRSRRKVRKNIKYNSEIVYVVVEGKTEKNYITYLKSLYQCNFQIDLSDKSTFSSIDKLLDKFCRQKSILREEVVLVYDLENDDMIKSKFIKDGRLVHERSYLCQPCIELHFLMHLGSFKHHSSQYYGVSEAMKLLKDQLPKYNKGVNFDWKQAGIGFHEIEKATKDSLKSFDSFDDNSFSMIGKFVEEVICK